MENVPNDIDMFVSGRLFQTLKFNFHIAIAGHNDVHISIC